MSKPEEFQRYSRTSGFTEGGSGTASGVAGEAGAQVPQGETFEQKLARIKRELDSGASPPRRVSVERQARAGHLRRQGEAASCAHAPVRELPGRACEDPAARRADLTRFEYIVVGNEHESLVLEKNLINQHAPWFNADFKDDKSYPFIAITKGDAFPAIKYTREKHRSDTRYFGPYTDSRAARRMVDIARRVVPLCSSSCADWRSLKRKLEKDPLACLASDARPCFDAHVGLGPGACCGRVTPERICRQRRRVSSVSSQATIGNSSKSFPGKCKKPRPSSISSGPAASRRASTPSTDCAISSMR